MKLILTVDTFKSGDRNGIAWASATGIDAGGRRARAAFRDPREGDGRKRATAMIEQMARAIPEGQDVSDIKPIVECLGSWRDRPLFRDGKPIMRGNEQVKERYFETASFTVLSGPALELRRTKQRASEVVDVVSAALQAGDAAKAAEAALEFLRVFSGRPADEIEDADVDEPDAPDAPASDVLPDARAAADLPSTAQVVVGAASPAPIDVAPIPDPAAAEEPVVPGPVAETPVVETAEVRMPPADVETVVDEVLASGAELETSQVPEKSAPAVDAGVALADDFESLVAAVEAAPPLAVEPAAEVVAEPAPAAQAAVRPDPVARPAAAGPGARPALPPRPAMGGPQRPAAAPARPSVGAGAQPPVRPQTGVAHAAPAAPARAPAGPTQTGPVRVGPAPGAVRPVSAPRLAPSAAVAPPVGSGYRRTEPGEDPEALAAVHMAKASRPGMPQAVRPAPPRPGVR